MYLDTYILTHLHTYTHTYKNTLWYPRKASTHADVAPLAIRWQLQRILSALYLQCVFVVVRVFMIFLMSPRKCY